MGRERRQLLGVKLGASERAALDSAASAANRTLSDEVRARLAYAQQCMPAGWRPDSAPAEGTTT